MTSSAFLTKSSITRATLFFLALGYPLAVVSSLFLLITILFLFKFIAILKLIIHAFIITLESLITVSERVQGIGWAFSFAHDAAVV